MAKNVQTPENAPYGHFPLGFWGKNFENFRKIFLAQNGIKTHFRYLVSTSETVGYVYAPTRHIGAFENSLSKMAIFPQMKKIEGCACWVHILGVRCGENKVLYHTFIPYK